MQNKATKVNWVITDTCPDATKKAVQLAQHKINISAGLRKDL